MPVDIKFPMEFNEKKVDNENEVPIPTIHDLLTELEGTQTEICLIFLAFCHSQESDILLKLDGLNLYNGFSFVYLFKLC